MSYYCKPVPPFSGFKLKNVHHTLDNYLQKGDDYFWDVSLGLWLQAKFNVITYTLGLVKINDCLSPVNCRWVEIQSFTSVSLFGTIYENEI